MRKEAGIGLILVFWLATASAGELSVTISGRTYHFEKTKQEYNENNVGVGLQYDFEPNGSWVPFLTAGGFVDSFGDLSYTAGGGYHRRFQLTNGDEGLFLDLGGTALLMTRQTFKSNQPFPVALPSASFGNSRMAINVTYVPEYQAWINPLLFFQVKYPLQK